MSNDDKKDYDVGYGKPPKHTRFGQPDGNKGNTKGRPPGRNIIEYDRLSEEALWDSFIQAGQTPVGISEGGQDLLVPLVMALAKRMAQDAVKGDRHARKDFLRFLEKATKGSDKLFLEMQSIMADNRDRKLDGLQNPGTWKHFESMNAWFRAKRDLRALDGEDRWLYEEGEPRTDNDWIVFSRCLEHLTSNPTDVLPWPPKYLSDDPE